MLPQNRVGYGYGPTKVSETRYVTGPPNLLPPFPLNIAAVSERRLSYFSQLPNFGSLLYV